MFPEKALMVAGVPSEGTSSVGSNHGDSMFRGLAFAGRPARGRACSLLTSVSSVGRSYPHILSTFGFFFFFLNHIAYGLKNNFKKV